MELRIVMERFAMADFKPRQLLQDERTLMTPSVFFLASWPGKLADAPSPNGRTRSVALALLGVLLLTSSPLIPLRAQAGAASSIQWNVQCDPPSGGLQDHGQVCA